MNMNDIPRIVGVLAIAYGAYRLFGIPGAVITVGLALCNKI